MTFTTEMFALSPSAYVKAVGRRWLMPRLWIPIIAVLLCLALGACVTAAFFYVALMLLFLVYPFMLANVYYAYGLKPGKQGVASKSMLQVTDDALILSLFHLPPDDEQAQPRQIAQISVALSDVCDLTQSKTTDVVIYGRKADDLIVIPQDAYPSPEIRARFHEQIYALIQQKYVNLQS